MRHNTPIYSSNITVDIFKKIKIQVFNKQTHLANYKLELVVVKGFTKEHIVEKNMKRIMRELSKKHKTSETEIVKVSKVELLVQLGQGVPFND